MYKATKILATKAFEAANEFIAPRHCEICGHLINSSIEQSKWVCSECEHRFIIAPTADEIKNKMFRNIEKDESGISNFYCLYQYNDEKGFSVLIKDLKYSGFTRIGSHYGSVLGRKILSESDVIYDFVIPVPIHFAKKRERGYNQSESIATAIAKEIKSSCNFEIIYRKVYTQTQTLLKSNERQTNVEGVFDLKKNHPELKNKILLLTDDVLTTGSTLNACAVLLLENGARQVDIATLAIAV
ncbi:MAG: phosphoribosyltransferase family protein [Candidatus Kapabacteria bacterium]|nr:phosphoribosyltransferase family protein [Candidatus Kapabacteria bacterium]